MAAQPLETVGDGVAEEVVVTGSPDHILDRDQGIEGAEAVPGEASRKVDANGPDTEIAAEICSVLVLIVADCVDAAPLR